MKDADIQSIAEAVAARTESLEGAIMLTTAVQVVIFETILEFIKSQKTGEREAELIERAVSDFFEWTALTPIVAAAVKRVFPGYEPSAWTGRIFWADPPSSWIRTAARALMFWAVVKLANLAAKI